MTLCLSETKEQHVRGRHDSSGNFYTTAYELCPKCSITLHRCELLTQTIVSCGTRLPHRQSANIKHVFCYSHTEDMNNSNYVRLILKDFL